MIVRPVCVIITAYVSLPYPKASTQKTIKTLFLSHISLPSLPIPHSLQI